MWCFLCVRVVELRGVGGACWCVLGARTRARPAAFVHAQKDFGYYESCCEAIRELSGDAKIFCLVHKMDLLDESLRAKARPLLPPPATHTHTHTHTQTHTHLRPPLAPLGDTHTLAFRHSVSGLHKLRRGRAASQ